MTSTARLRKLEMERLALETAYTDALIQALRDCVGGHWGLFGQNDGKLPSSMENQYKPDSVKELDRLGNELLSVRDELGFTDLFAPMQRLKEFRLQKGPNQIGEPRLALLLLEELKD